MKTAAELAAIAAAHRQDVAAGQTAEQLAADARFEAQVAKIMAEFRAELAKVDAVAATGGRNLYLRTVQGDVTDETDTPLAIAWNRLAAELQAKGFKVTVAAHSYYDGGWDMVSGYRTNFRIDW